MDSRNWNKNQWLEEKDVSKKSERKVQRKKDMEKGDCKMWTVTDCRTSVFRMLKFFAEVKGTKMGKQTEHKLHMMENKPQVVKSVL